MEAPEFLEAGEDFIVLPARFTEAQAGIQDDLRAAHPSRHRTPQRSLQAPRERAPDVLREGFPLHRFGAAAKVHQDEGGMIAARDVRQARVEAQSADIIHNVRASAQRFLNHLGFGGVNGDGNGAQLSPQAPDDGQHAPQFFFCRNRLRTGPRGFTAHVNPVGLPREPVAVRAGGRARAPSRAPHPRRSPESR